MRKHIFNTLAVFVAAVSFMTVPAAGEAMSLAEEKPLAGLTISLDKYCDAVIEDKEKEEAKIAEERENEDSIETPAPSAEPAQKTDKKDKTKKEEEHLKLNLVYDRLGVANVHNYLNVRKSPSKSSKIAGKMTRNSGCNIYKIKKGWAKIVSGKVKGWVKAEYLLTDEKAEARAKKVATLRATVSTETLNVRTLPSTDSTIYDQISAEEEYRVGNENITKKWLKKYISKYCSKKELRSIDMDKMYKDAKNWVMLKIDEEKVFVSKDFINFTYNLNRAVKIKPPVRKSSSSGSSSNDSGSSDSSSYSTGSAIVNYAMQFLGNRYVWGGTSLTNGTDCSGFVMRIYEHFGYYLPRTSRAQAAATRTVSSSEVQIGDLFFYGSGSVSHVALYIGGGQIIHASNSTDGIKISSAYYRQPLKIGRVM